MFAEKGHVKILGEDRLAFKGQPAVFECQAAGWYPKPALWWQVNKVRSHSEASAVPHVKNIRAKLTPSLLCFCVEAKQDVFNVSAGAEANGVFSVTSSLLLTADTTSRVDCLAFVSALAQPLRASVGLTVGEPLQEQRAMSHHSPVITKILVVILFSRI